MKLSGDAPEAISDTLLTLDHSTIDAKNITFEIWKNRMNKDFVGKFIELLR